MINIILHAASQSELLDHVITCLFEPTSLFLSERMVWPKGQNFARYHPFSVCCFEACCVSGIGGYHQHCSDCNSFHPEQVGARDAFSADSLHWYILHLSLKKVAASPPVSLNCQLKTYEWGKDRLAELITEILRPNKEKIIYTNNYRLVLCFS